MRCATPRFRLVSVLVAASLVAAACSSSDDGTDGTDTDTDVVDTTGDTPDDSSDDSTVTATDEEGDDDSGDGGERVERGSLDWAPCPDDVGGTGGVIALECSTLVVPLDHADPDGPTLDIAVARVQATGADADRIGSLVFNPGGPGGSGVESLGFVALTMSQEVLDRFDLVSFDPRGVGASTALECDLDLDDGVILLEAGDDAGWQELLDLGEEDLAACTPETLDLATHVGTTDAARDLDLLREALGDEGLSYVGYSYGTRLGATYAELFPDKVRALVLDGAVKPSDDLAALGAEQGEGFDRALENFAAACDADEDCLLREFGATLDVIAGLEEEIAEVGSFPTDDPGRVLTPGELSFGIAAALYSSESWPFLAQGLYLAETEQDGTLLQVLADSLLGREVDGTYDNSQVASVFVNCADDPSRPSADEQRALAEAAAERSRYFTDFLRADTGCVGVPLSDDPLVLGPAEGAPPIVVVGTTGDPATPYEWAVELAEFLDSGVLYTVEGEGHTAYGSIQCATPALDAYLVDLEVPADGASCESDETADFFVPVEETEVGQILAFFDCLRDGGVEIPEVTTADVLADPTLDTILADLDFGDPAFLEAIDACQSLVPEI